MYEPPIELVMTQMQTEVENEIFRAIQKVGVNVDKEELEKALRYDREQYNKGYDDAVEEFAERVLELFPFDKMFTTISRGTIRTIANELTHQPTKIEHSSLCETETYESR